MTNDITEDAVKEKLLFVPCKDKKTLHKWIKLFLDIDIPDSLVDPTSNCSMMQMIWEVYEHFLYTNDPNRSRILYYASRDSGKTLAESIIEVLALLHLRINVVHLSAIEEQSRNAQKYVKNFFAKNPQCQYVVGDNVRETEIVRYEHRKTGETLSPSRYSRLLEEEKLHYRESRNKTEIIVATVQSTNGKHGLMLCLDEIEIIKDIRAYDESKLIPTAINRGGKVVYPLTVLTSTRKYSMGLVQNEIDNADKTGLEIRHWNILDVTERCPPERHRPDLPRLPVYYSPENLRTLSEPEYDQLHTELQSKYTREEAWHGCLKGCKLYAACRGRLVTEQKSSSAFLKPISHVINLFSALSMSVETARAQLLCWKPSSEGLIYSNLSKEIHMLSANDMYTRLLGINTEKEISKRELIKIISEKGQGHWFAGMDFGYTHNFAVVTGYKDGDRIFVMDVICRSELEPSEQIDACSHLRGLGATIFPDPENPQLINLFKKSGFRMREWSKGKGSVVGGIDIVRSLLMPAVGEPRLYFLQGDEGCELLVKQMGTYHWKVDSTGGLTDKPDEKDDDLPDALRYLAMNLFDTAGRLIVPGDVAPSAPHYSRNGWMSDVIAERTGVTDHGDDLLSSSLSGKSGGFLWNF